MRILKKDNLSKILHHYYIFQMKKPRFRIKNDVALIL